MDQISHLQTVADPEICPGGPDDSRNLQPVVAAIFFLTSFNRGKGEPGPPASPPLGSTTAKSIHHTTLQYERFRMTLIMLKIMKLSYWNLF